QPGEAAPASFQRPKARVMEHGVELIAERGIDVGDVAIERGTQPAAARSQQAGQGVAEPHLQCLAIAELAVKEGGKLPALLTVLSAEEAPSHHRLAQRRPLSSRLLLGGCDRCFLAHGMPVPPMMAAGVRSKGSGGQAFWGMLATMRRLVVSSSNCS